MSKRTSFFIGIVICLFLCTPIFAEGFYIENYIIDLQVNKYKQIHVTEDIDVSFTEASHGIYREIPYNNAKIINVYASERYSTSSRNNKLNIKIGNPDRLTYGRHFYKISYDFCYSDNINELYHNIIGTDWPTEIRHVKFKLSMPKEFNPSDVGLSIGKYGTKGFEGDAEFSVNGLKVIGQVKRTLQPGEGVTIRIVLPEGYFTKVPPVKEEHVVRNNIIFGILLCIITLISFTVWYKVGKDEKVIPVVNFYPPEGMNTLEVEIAYKEKASLRGLIAMIISLAQKGYIRIHEESHSFSFERLKPYDGNDKLEERYMKALFSVKRISEKKTDEIVTEKDLEKSKTFYNECSNIVSKANRKRKLLYEEASVNWKLRVLMFFCFFVALFINIYICSKFSYSDSSSEIACMLIFGFTIFWAKCHGELDDLSLIFLLTLPFISFVFFYIANIKYNVQYIPVTSMGIASVAICFVCMYHLKKRNKKALKIFGDLLGFKKFIETAEKEQLESLVYDDPQYFYNILPYAYLFKVSNKWIKKFESIISENPSWYTGKEFNSLSFSHLIGTIKRVSVPSIANGGKQASSSGGGGGFVGGGFGGGGGGRW